MFIVELVMGMFAVVANIHCALLLLRTKLINAGFLK